MAAGGGISLLRVACCSALLFVAPHRGVLRRIAAYCGALFWFIAPLRDRPIAARCILWCNSAALVAARCGSSQRIAARCGSSQRIAARCGSSQRIAARCGDLPALGPVGTGHPAPGGGDSSRVFGQRAAISSNRPQ